MRLRRGLGGIEAAGLPASPCCIFAASRSMLLPSPHPILHRRERSAQFLHNFSGDNVRYLARSFAAPGDHDGQESRGYRVPYGPTGASQFARSLSLASSVAGRRLHAAAAALLLMRWACSRSARVLAPPVCAEHARGEHAPPDSLRRPLLPPFFPSAP